MGKKLVTLQVSHCFVGYGTEDCKHHCKRTAYKPTLNCLLKADHKPTLIEDMHVIGPFSTPLTLLHCLGTTERTRCSLICKLNFEAPAHLYNP